MNTCASCGTNNVEGTKFCVSCGAALAPAPGAWRAGTDELSGQAPNPASSSSSYTPPNPQPYPYPSPPTQGALYQQPAGTAIPYGQLNYAEWIDRVLAALIDGALNIVVMIVLFIIFGALAGVSAGVGGSDNPFPGGILCLGTLITMLSVFILGLFNKVYLVSKRGSSIGQGLMHLKVVDATGKIPPIGTLIIRLLVQVGLGVIPIVGWLLVLTDLLFPLWDEKKQTIHDKAASTYVIKVA